MSFAFTHLMLPWLIGLIFQRLSKKKISRYTWFFLVLGGILPDADLLLDWMFKFDLHRTFSHSLIFLIGAPLILYFGLWLAKDAKKNIFPVALAVGVACHLLLDLHTFPGIPLFWPDFLHYSYSSIHLYDHSTPSFLNSTSLQDLQWMLKRSVIDMALGTSWIFYLWWKRRLRF
jgi:hypothetical protein